MGTIFHFKDEFIEYPSDLILRCKAYHEKDMREKFSEKRFNNESRSLRYYDLLILYNNLRCVKKVTEVADDYGSNTAAYIRTAYMRVKRFAEGSE